MSSPRVFLRREKRYPYGGSRPLPNEIRVNKRTSMVAGHVGGPNHAVWPLPYRPSMTPRHLSLPANRHSASVAPRTRTLPADFIAARPASPDHAGDHGAEGPASPPFEVHSVPFSPPRSGRDTISARGAWRERGEVGRDIFCPPGRKSRERVSKEGRAVPEVRVGPAHEKTSEDVDEEAPQISPGYSPGAVIPGAIGAGRRVGSARRPPRENETRKRRVKRCGPSPAVPCPSPSSRPSRSWSSSTSTTTAAAPGGTGGDASGGTPPPRRRLRRAVLRESTTVITPLTHLPERSARGAVEGLCGRLMGGPGMRDDFDDDGNDDRAGGEDKENAEDGGNPAEAPQDRGDGDEGGDEEKSPRVRFDSGTKGPSTPSSEPSSLPPPEVPEKPKLVRVGTYAPPRHVAPGLTVYHAALRVDDLRAALEEEKADGESYRSRSLTALNGAASALLPGTDLPSLVSDGPAQPCLVVLAVGSAGPPCDLHGSPFLMSLPGRIREFLDLLSSPDLPGDAGSGRLRLVRAVMAGVLDDGLQKGTRPTMRAGEGHRQHHGPPGEPAGPPDEHRVGQERDAPGIGTVHLHDEAWGLEEGRAGPVRACPTTAAGTGRDPACE
ncbi:hypothetical protein THAOC_25649, partial [Thalassiosira oceanica]